MKANLGQKDLDPYEDCELRMFLEGGLDKCSVRTHYLGQLYYMEKGKLYRRTKGGIRYVPPVGEREFIVKHLHYLSAHAGLKRLLGLLSRRFFWPGMAGMATLMLRRCTICQADSPSYLQPIVDKAL